MSGGVPCTPRYVGLIGTAYPRVSKEGGMPGCQMRHPRTTEGVFASF